MSFMTRKRTHGRYTKRQWGVTAMRLVGVEGGCAVEKFILNRGCRWVVGVTAASSIFLVTSLLANEPSLNWQPRAFLSTMLGVAFVAILSNKAKIAKLNRDVLTKLYRRLWIDELMAKFTRDRRDVTIALIDINGLREVNRRGHAAGDEFLELVAHRLRNVIGRHRKRWIARLGGDEFLVLGVDVSIEEMTEEVRWALHYQHPTTGMWGLGVAGVARSRRGDCPLALRCADMALLRAKQNYYNTQNSEVYGYNHTLDGTPRIDLDLTKRPTTRIRDK